MSKEIQEDIATDLEAVFGFIIAKVKQDKVFAKQIAAAISDPSSLRNRSENLVDWSKRAPDIDLRDLFESRGIDAVRKSVESMNKDKLYALVRAQDISPRGTSNYNLGPLREHVISYFLKQNQTDQFSY